MANILIIKHGSLGDIVQASGAIQDISENHRWWNSFTGDFLKYAILLILTKTIDDFGKNFDGNLRNYRFISSNQVEANYLIKESNANLKLKFFLKDRSNDFKLSSVSDGVTINLKKGDKPMIINLSSDKLSNQKLINISNLFLK